MTLYAEFLKPDHRVTGKWVHYFPVYNRHFSRFRDQYITLFEIGVALGGSLQLWKRFFGPNIRIVGIDVVESCREFAEDQIDIRIGHQSDPAFAARLLEEYGAPDIVIDDASHQQEHINATFDLLYPHVAKNGVYLVEDLHTAYDPNYGGGLGRAGTFIERTKTLIDALHAKHTQGALAETDFSRRTDSVHVYDSVVVFEVGEQRHRYDRWVGSPPPA